MTSLTSQLVKETYGQANSEYSIVIHLQELNSDAFELMLKIVRSIFEGASRQSGRRINMHDQTPTTPFSSKWVSLEKGKL